MWMMCRRIDRGGGAATDRDVAEDKIFNDEESVRRLVKGWVARVAWACYEAGPTGYDLHRLLTALPVRCGDGGPVFDPERFGRSGED
jgi:hypothetical protein